MDTTRELNILYYSNSAKLEDLYFAFREIVSETDPYRYYSHFKISEITKPLDDNLTYEDCVDFPNNIKTLFWTFEGTNDEESWRCFCQLNNDLYAFYIAECDYTGFGCQGSMELYISSDFSKIIEKAMSDKDYYLYRYNAKEIYIDYSLVKSCKY